MARFSRNVGARTEALIYRNRVFLSLLVFATAWLCAMMSFVPKLRIGRVGEKTKAWSLSLKGGDGARIFSSSYPFQSLPGGDAVSGVVFRGEKTRSYEGERIFRSLPSSPPSKDTTTTTPKALPLMDPAIRCKNWNVVTTIFDPSEAVRRACWVEGWCTVIVADTKTPEGYMEKLRNMGGIVGSDTESRFIRTGRRRSEKQEGKDEDEGIVVFLSIDDQKEWMQLERGSSSATSDSTAVGKFLEAIPFRSFARKNIGYLYAIAHGAQKIFDFDDDNLLPVSLGKDGEERVFAPFHNRDALENPAMVVTGPTAFNHHNIMGISVNGTSWPRGFPLTQITNPATRGRIALESKAFRDVPMSEIGILQFVADNNPDVDAIHRLVQGQMNPTTGETVHFKRHVKYDSNSSREEAANYYNTVSEISTEGSLLVPSHAYVSFNAQATVFTHQAMFGLLLPHTVMGRVADIWRAYFSQRIFREVRTPKRESSFGNDGLKVVILPPDIVQERNEHNLLGDLQSEEHLYCRTEALLSFLDKWEYEGDKDGDNRSIPAMMEKLWIGLYERDFIEKQDIEVLQLWLSALVEVGYEFPKVQSNSARQIRDVVVMGQFNYGSSKVADNQDELMKTNLLFWYQKWRQRFRKVVIRGPFSADLAKEFSEQHEIDVESTRDRLSHDKGFVSPMDNLLSTLKKYEDDPTISGVLYVHDDMIVNVTNVFDGVNRTTTVLGTRFLTAPQPYRIHPSWASNSKPNSTDKTLIFTAPDGFRTEKWYELLGHLENWDHNPECIHQFSNIANDPRIKPYLEHDETIENGNPYLSVPYRMQADFLYIPTRLSRKYEEIANLLIEHNAFLECGVPKIVQHVTTASSNVIFKFVDLCTSFLNRRTRGSLNMITRCEPEYANSQPNTPLPSPHGAIHPIKINARGYKTWGMLFDWATSGTTRLNVADYEN